MMCIIKYKGFATLTVTFILVMITAVLVMAVTRIQILGLQESGNELKYRKQFLETASILDEVTNYIANNFNDIQWLKAGKEQEHSEILKSTLNVTSSLSITTGFTVNLTRKTTSPDIVHIQITTKDANEHSVNHSLAIRPHGILSVAGETAPPLIINGCILSTQGDIHLYPDSTMDGSISLLINTQSACHSFNAIDFHQGGLAEIDFDGGELWGRLFSISRKEFISLTKEDESLTSDIHQRRFIIATQENLTAGSWQTTLGTTESPVIILFPESLPCPAIQGYAIITGIVIYEGDCATHSLQIQGTIKGTLIINSDAHLKGDSATLEHISHSNPNNKLNFPITHALQLPGTWIDY